MLGRLAAVAAMAALMASCAGMESAGRNASRSPQPASSPVAARSPDPAPAYVPPAPVASAPLPAAAPTPAPAAAAPAPVVATPPPSRAPVLTQPTPRPAPSSAAATEPPTRRIDTQARGDDVVVPAERERQVQAPNGDPRSASERMTDINAWDRCVTHVQSAFERDPMRPQLQSPEEYCSQSLGMANRDAIPLSRVERRR